MDYSNPIALAARRVGQKLGVLRPMVRAWRRLMQSGYEDRFDAALLAEVREGDVVWDIGANVGIYTLKFSEAVGPTGRVVAFEPSPDPIEMLRASTADRGNVEIMTVALSDQPGEAQFFSSTTGYSPSDGLRPRHDSDRMTVVPVRRGDDYRAGGAPTVIKIDVEGFEREVLKGMPETLRDPNLRALFVEVHFQDSADRGAASAPREVAQMIREAGMTLRWIDPSHLEARR